MKISHIIIAGIAGILCILLFVAFSVGIGTEPGSPKIIGTSAVPYKVKPGDFLTIYAEFIDPVGIKTAMAEFQHEKGKDVIEMQLTAGNEKEGTYLVEWKVHDTKDKKIYYTTVTLTNNDGKKTVVDVEWRDDTVFHPFAQLVFDVLADSADITNGTLGIDAFDDTEVQKTIANTDCGANNWVSSVTQTGAVNCVADSSAAPSLSCTVASGSGSGQQVFATCPGGYTLLGGGCSTTTSGVVFGALSSTTVFTCQNLLGEGGITAYARCCQKV